MLPRLAARHDETYLIKSTAEWEYAHVTASSAEEIAALFAAHADVLHQTARMFTTLPQLAEEAGVHLPITSDDAFFRIAYRAGKESAVGRPFSEDTLRQYMREHFGSTTYSDKLYQQVLNELAEPDVRADLTNDLEAAWAARDGWNGSSDDIERVWDVIVREISAALGQREVDFPADPPDLHSGLDTGRILELNAYRWGLRAGTSVQRPQLGMAVTLPYDLPLDRTIAVRVLSVLGRGTVGRDLQTAGLTARELLEDAVLRSARPAGLAEDASRSTLALSAVAADLLRVEEPAQVPDSYGRGAQMFGREVSRAFGKAVAQWRRYAGQKSPSGADGPEQDAEGRDAARERFMVNQALANEMQSRLGEADQLLVQAVWTNRHSEEVRGRDLPNLQTARATVRRRATHVASEICAAVKKARSDAVVHERLAIWIQEVCLRLEHEDMLRIVHHGLGPLPPDLREAMRRANDEVSQEEGEQVRVTAAHLARFRRTGRDR